jgi:phosphoglycerate dehydrogenase-like enzyme
MAAQTSFVLVHMPPGLRTLFGEERLRQLVAAHPRAEVALVDDPDRFAELLPRADAAMVFPAMVSLLTPALRPGSRLCWVHSIPVGVEGLLTPEVVAAEHIVLTSSKGSIGPMVAEHALMLMLALARDLPGLARSQAARRWDAQDEVRPMLDLFSKTVLVLGVGGIGGHLARICRVGLQMRVLGTARTRCNDPHVHRYVDLADLPAALGEADLVVLCLPLTSETRCIIDAAALAAMRPTAFLVNVARGGLVDEEALIAALQAGSIAGAGLDSFAAEPLPADSPLWAMPNVIITPHVAPSGDRAPGEAAAFLRENIRRFAEGEPLLGSVDRHARY